MCMFLTLHFCRQLWCFFFFKQKTAYEMRISDWSSDVCSSDLLAVATLEANSVTRMTSATNTRATISGGTTESGCSAVPSQVARPDSVIPAADRKSVV